MAKILFIHPYAESEFARQSIPISLISTLLKKHGHICEIFDTTFLDNEILRGIRPDHDKTLAANFYFKKWDSDKFIKLKKKGNIFYLLQEKIDSFAPDIITFSFWGSHLHAEGEYFSYHNGVKLINNVNLNKNSITIVGGTIPSSNPEGVLRKEKKINYVIKGESEFVYLDLANAIDRKQNLNNILNLNFLVENKFYSNQLRPLIDPLDQLPDVNLDIYDSNTFYRPYHGKVVRMIDYELSRGCWYRCTFCLSPFQREATYNKAKNFRREKSVHKIIREILNIKKKYNLEFIRYQDETFNSMNEDKLRELSKEYKKYVNLPFLIEATVNTSSENKIRYLAEMGCVSVGLGIESGSLRIREKIIVKPKFSNKEVVDVISCFKKNKISVTAYNILGFPTETKEDILETIEINYLSKPSFSTVSYFQPWEGTSLKKTAIADGSLIGNVDFDSESPGQQGQSPLTLNSISKIDLEHYHDNFSFYVNLNKSFWPLISLLKKKNLFSKIIYKFLSFMLLFDVKLRKIIKK